MKEDRRVNCHALKTNTSPKNRKSRLPDSSGRARKRENGFSG
jgi:hypothetical protein